MFAGTVTVIDAKGLPVEVPGERIRFDGFPHGFLLHLKLPRDLGERFVVSEASTGGIVARADFRHQALDIARQRLEHKGVEGLNRAIQRLVQSRAAALRKGAEGYVRFRAGGQILRDAIIRAAQDDENIGFCVACGAEADGVEPDARAYECDICGAHKVYGAEHLLLSIA